MALTYRAISFWPGAFHVYNEEERIGIVNERLVRTWNGKKMLERQVWFAHNYNFFTIQGEFKSRTDAAEAIPKGKVHQPVEAFS